MKYDMDETCREVIKRGKKMRALRLKKNVEHFSVATAVLAVMVVIVNAWAGGTATMGTVAHTSFGATLLYADSGVYMLVGIIAFALGVAITMLCVHFKDKKQEDRRMSMQGGISREHG